ncbi:MAG: hypothetical protein ACLSEX_15160, partial [Blautia sp.]
YIVPNDIDSILGSIYNVRIGEALSFAGGKEEIFGSGGLVHRMYKYIERKVIRRKTASDRTDKSRL